jgi:hypothetical protein
MKTLPVSNIDGSDIVKEVVTKSGFHPKALPAALSKRVTLFIKLSAGFVGVNAPSAMSPDVTALGAILSVIIESDAAFDSLRSHLPNQLYLSGHPESYL